MISLPNNDGLMDRRTLILPLHTASPSHDVTRRRAGQMTQASPYLALIPAAAPNPPYLLRCQSVQTLLTYVLDRRGSDRESEGSIHFSGRY
jgi:hypothetical protein